MVIAIDIDDTLLVCDKEPCPCCGRMKYSNPRPIREEIERVNAAHDMHTIILRTGRQEDVREVTERQLAEFGIKYHVLEMGRRAEKYIDSTNSHQSLSEVF